jgi:acyl carrier protein
MTDFDPRHDVAEALATIAPDVDPGDWDGDLHDDLGLDSMDLVNLAAAITQRTGIDIPERDYAGLRTLRQIEGYLTACADDRGAGR